MPMNRNEMFEKLVEGFWPTDIHERKDGTIYSTFTGIFSCSHSKGKGEKRHKAIISYDTGRPQNPWWIHPGCFNRIGSQSSHVSAEPVTCKRCGK